MYIAMGEVEQFNDAVHHGIAECHQGVEGAQNQPVDELLNGDVKDRH